MTLSFVALASHQIPGSELVQEIWKPSFRRTTEGSSTRAIQRSQLTPHVTAEWGVAVLCKVTAKHPVFTKPQWNLATRLQHISGAPTTLRSVTVYTTWTPLLCHYTYGITASTKPPILNGRSSARPNHIDPDVATASYVEIGHTCRQRCWIYIAYYIDTRVWAFDWCELLQSSIQSPYMNTSVSIQSAI